MTSLYKQLIKEPFIMFIAGSPRSGKTTIITKLLTKMKGDPLIEDPIVSVFCGSIFSNRPHAYMGYHCSPTFSESKLNSILKLVSENTDRRFVLIFDDMVSDPNLKWNAGFMANLVCKYRHYGNLSIIIATQYVNKIPPVIRDCSKFAIVFAQKTKKTKEAVIDTFLDEFDNIDELDKWNKKNNIKLGNHRYAWKNLDTGMNPQASKNI